MSHDTKQMSRYRQARGSTRFMLAEKSNGQLMTNNLKHCHFLKQEAMNEPPLPITHERKKTKERQEVNNHVDVSSILPHINYST